MRTGHVSRKRLPVSAGGGAFAYPTWDVDPARRPLARQLDTVLTRIAGWQPIALSRAPANLENLSRGRSEQSVPSLAAGIN